jgi:DnaJ-class molecular chaperone
LSDKDKRAQFDRGEIDGEGNPAGFGGGFGAGGFGVALAAAVNVALAAMAPRAWTLAIFLKDLWRSHRRRWRVRRRRLWRHAPPKGQNRAYRLAVTLPDAAICANQRITLADGKTVDVKLPKGVEDGMQIRLSGKGDPGPGGPGDAMITIAVMPHAYFRRDGDDIRVDVPVTLDEAVFGGKVKVPTVDGAVMLTVAPGSSSGKTLRIKGRGFTRKDGRAATNM